MTEPKHIAQFVLAGVAILALVLVSSLAGEMAGGLALRSGILM